MYDSSPEFLSKFEPELRKRAAFVAYTFLERGVAPRLINSDGYARYALPAFWGWSLSELQIRGEEVEKPAGRLCRGDIYRSFENDYESHYLSADGFLLFGSFCLNVCYRSGLPDDVGVKGGTKFGVATTEEIGYLDFSMNSPRHVRFRRERDRVESWSVERRRKPQVEIWGMGISRRINALAGALVDAATFNLLCPSGF